METKLDPNRMFWFVKFSEKQEYLTDLQNGNLYMNNGEYFINREKQDGIQGLGDKNELSAVLNNVELKFFDSDTSEFLFDGEAQRLSFNYNYTLTKPIFCLTYIDHESLNIIKVNEDSVECQMNVNAKLE